MPWSFSSWIFQKRCGPGCSIRELQVWVGGGGARTHSVSGAQQGDGGVLHTLAEPWQPATPVSWVLQRGSTYGLAVRPRSGRQGHCGAWRGNVRAAERPHASMRHASGDNSSASCSISSMKTLDRHQSAEASRESTRAKRASSPGIGRSRTAELLCASYCDDIHAHMGIWRAA